MAISRAASGWRRALATAALATLALAPPAAAETTLKVSLHSDLKIVDPVWTTALISTHHGMMVYDTLFALDRNLQVQPQMVDKWTVSDDKLTWTFTLRDGLEWHDGAPVTAEDCVASLQRWSARDGMGQKLMSFVAELKATDAKTFVMKLKEPYGLVLSTLGKPTSNIPFMMPKRVAETEPQHADHRDHRLRPLHLQEGRMEARREGRLPQEPQVQAARRAGLGLCRRQGRQGRPRRVDLDRGRADLGQRAAQRRDRFHRGAAARSAAPARQRSPTSSSWSSPPWGASTRSASTCCTSPSTTPRCARRWPTPSTRRTSSTPPSAIPSTT